MNNTQHARRPVGQQHRGGSWMRRRALARAAAMPLGCVLLFAGQAVALLAAGSEPSQGAASSPSDRPPAPQQPAAQQPAAKAAVSTCKVYLGRGRRLRARTRCCAVQPAAPAPCAASAGVAAVAHPDPYAWKALFDGETLSGWKSPEFGGEGRVSVEDGMIVMEMGNNMTGVAFTGQVPRDNYELSLEGMRLQGTDFFCTTTFPVGKDPCTLVVGGWGGTVVGLSNVDFFDASENPTTTFQAFKDNQWYRVRIRVTEAKIEAWLDDEQVVDQEREEHKFGIRFEVDLCQPLGIATWCTKGAVRNIRLRQLPPTPAADQPPQK